MVIVILIEIEEKTRSSRPQTLEGPRNSPTCVRLCARTGRYLLKILNNVFCQFPELQGWRAVLIVD